MHPFCVAKQVRTGLKTVSLTGPRASLGPKQILQNPAKGLQPAYKASPAGNGGRQPRGVLSRGIHGENGKTLA